MSPEKRLEYVKCFYGNLTTLKVASYIYNNPRCTNADIAKKTKLSRSQVSQSLSPMVEHGLVIVYEKQQDRRSGFIEMTQKGKKLMEI